MGPGEGMRTPYNGRGPSARLEDVLAHISHSDLAGVGSPQALSSTMATTATTTARKLPTFDELPTFKEFTGCAWEVWGKDDQLGTVNLLTPEVVKEASKEIKCVPARHLYLGVPIRLLMTSLPYSCRTGKSICLNWCVHSIGRIVAFTLHRVLTRTGHTRRMDMPPTGL